MGSNDWCCCRNGILCRHWSDYPWCMVNDVLVIAASLIGGFIFASLLTEDVHDDDDDQGGGMMIPATVPAGG